MWLSSSYIPDEAEVFGRPERGILQTHASPPAFQGFIIPLNASHQCMGLKRTNGTEHGMGLEGEALDAIFS
ncbi:hypothetical protein IHE44_0001555, partial [Lamprotornis superbus]